MSKTNKWLWLNAELKVRHVMAASCTSCEVVTTIVTDEYPKEEPDDDLRRKVDALMDDCKCGGKKVIEPALGGLQIMKEVK